MPLVIEFDHICGKAARQRVDHSLRLPQSVRSQIVDNGAHGQGTEASEVSCLHEMAGDDIVDRVVVIFACGHGELEFLVRNLVSIKAGLGGQHVIERGHAEAPAGGDENAEILGVTVGRAKHPKDDACAHKGCNIGFRCVAALEQVDDIAHAGAAVGLVFSRRGDRQGLAGIFLWQSQQTVVPRPAAIEALNDQCAPFSEIGDLDIRGGYAQCLQQLQAQILILDAIRKVDPVGELADLRLEDVGGGGRAGGFEPLASHAQQGGFFLGTGY